MAWANSCVKSSSASSLLHQSTSASGLRHSNKQLRCSEFVFDSIGLLLKTERCCPISGFRVYASGGPRSLPKRRAGFTCAAATERWGRLAWRLVGSNVACQSWIVAPRISLTAIRSLKKKANGSPPPPGAPEQEIENLPRSRSKQAAPPGKLQVRTINKVSSTISSSKGLQSSSTHVESASSAEPSTRFDKKPKIRVVPGGGNEDRSGNESLTGRRSASWGVNISSKRSGPEVPKAKGLNPSSKSSKESDSWAKSNSRSSFSRTTTASAINLSDSQQEPVGSGVTLTSSFSAMNSHQNSNRRKVAGETKPKQQQQIERKPKKKDFPAEALLRRDLNMCSKDGDVLRALDIYDRSISDGIVKWNQYNFNIILYLCSSAALGTLTARKSGTDMADAERLNLQLSGKNPSGTGPVESTNGADQQQNVGSNDGETVNGAGGATTTNIVLSAEVMELAARRGFEVFEDMKKQEVPPNEATLTAVARLAVRREDGDLAFQMVKEMAAMNIAPKLRSYSPALVTFCKRKAVEKAFEVDAHMVAAGVQPEEPELGALLQLCVELGLDKQVYSLLHRLRARVRALSPSTVASIEQWFSGQTGASAGKESKQPEHAALRQAMVARGGGWHGLGWLGKGEWKSEWTTIDKQGFCRCCKKQLVTIDLDPKETENFAHSVSELAYSREAKSSDFKRFQEWLERHGPFDAIIDGANVGLYNQNFVQGGFNFFQLNAVATTAQDRGVARKAPLILLHHARTRFGAANSPLGQELIQKWSSSKTLYTTPNGSNDDWYWLYAAVKNKCLLITNDEMRDHLFQLLGSDFFPRWKERHQVRFSASARGLEFHLPPPYSIVIQESENGSWHFPKSGGNDVDAPLEWLCVMRTGFSLDSAALPDSGTATTVASVKVSTQISHHVGKAMAKDQNDSSPKPDSPETDGTSIASRRPKRARSHSPSTMLQKLKAADKKSDSGPVMFDI